MAGDHNHVDADPQELEKAQSFWNDFTKFTTYSVIAIIVILLAMALFLV